MVKRQWIQTIYFGLIQDHKASTRVFLGIIFDKHLSYWLSLHPTYIILHVELETLLLIWFELWNFYDCIRLLPAF